MRKYGIYTIIGLLAFIIGTTTVFAAPKLQSFTISSPDGTRHAEVSSDGRLFVQTNLPGAAHIVNLFESATEVLVNCVADDAIYQVPTGRFFLLTDMMLVGGLPQGVHVSTDGRGQLLENISFTSNRPFSWQTPLVFTPGEYICLSQGSANAVPTNLLLMGVLSPSS